MSDRFIGEIRMFGGNFAPQGWAFCDGQLMAISANEALFSLLGTIYGGDGRTTFGLPEMRGRIPIHTGTGPGLSPRRIGARSGSETVSLTVNELPSHSHGLNVNDRAATESPSDAVVAGHPADAGFSSAASDVAMDPGTVESAGGSASHSNLQPTLCVHFIIALQGIFPSRT